MPVLQASGMISPLHSVVNKSSSARLCAAELLFENGCTDVTSAFGNLDLMLLHEIDLVWDGHLWYL